MGFSLLLGEVHSHFCLVMALKPWMTHFKDLSGANSELEMNFPIFYSLLTFFMCLAIFRSRYLIGGSVLYYPQLSAISSYQLYVEVSQKNNSALRRIYFAEETKDIVVTGRV